MLEFEQLLASVNAASLNEEQFKAVQQGMDEAYSEMAAKAEQCALTNEELSRTYSL